MPPEFKMQKLIGPFKQLLGLANLPLQGPIKDDALRPLADAGVLIENTQIKKIAKWKVLLDEKDANTQVEALSGDYIGLPGFVDAHTHLCFAGSRAKDFNLRLAGMPYQEIAAQGGGIMNSVTATRKASSEELLHSLTQRLDQQLRNGITTCEIKSGYGLNENAELKILRCIKNANEKHPIDVVPTCLATHVVPAEYQNQRAEYLDLITESILPKISFNKLSRRVDIFIEEGAFSIDEGRDFLQKAKRQGFDICVHADQFSIGGSQLAVEILAQSADHLEASGALQIDQLARSETVAMVLPGASLGLGIPYAPARKLLDAGAALAIASDWNPGSAPMGDLLVQASLLAIFEKLSSAEIFAGLTYRAAKALGLADRGRLKIGFVADMIAFPSVDYREILYHQGMLKPHHAWKNGETVLSASGHAHV